MVDKKGSLGNDIKCFCVVYDGKIDLLKQYNLEQLYNCKCRSSGMHPIVINGDIMRPIIIRFYILSNSYSCIISTIMLFLVLSSHLSVGVLPASMMVIWVNLYYKKDFMTIYMVILQGDLIEHHIVHF